MRGRFERILKFTYIRNRWSARSRFNVVPETFLAIFNCIHICRQNNLLQTAASKENKLASIRINHKKIKTISSSRLPFIIYLGFIYPTSLQWHYTIHFIRSPLAWNFIENITELKISPSNQPRAREFAFCLYMCSIFRKYKCVVVMRYWNMYAATYLQNRHKLARNG